MLIGVAAASGLLNKGPRPALDLRFLGAAELPSCLTFSRSSLATLVDSAGKLTYARHNLLAFSEDFSNEAWAKTGTASATASVLSFPAVNDLVLQSTSAGAAQGTTEIFSVELRGTPGQTCRIVVDSSGGNYESNSQNVTLTADWQRVFVAMTWANAGHAAARCYVQRHTGQTATSVEARKAQFERVTYETAPRAYNPTAASVYYGPRFDCDPATLQPRGLLNEEQRTNLALRSNMETGWTGANLTFTANAGTSPDGTANATKMTPSVANNSKACSQNITSTAVAHAVSVYAKAAGYNFVKVRFYGSAAYVAETTFNLATGAIGSTVSGTASIQSVGNGWYRCTVVGTATGTAVAPDIAVANDAAGTTVFAGDGTSGILVYGVQLEAGAFVSTYIPAGSSQATRASESEIAQTVDGPELVRPLEWATGAAGSSTAANNAGTLTLIGDGTNFAYADQAFPTVVGRSYVLDYDVTANAAQRCIGTTRGGTEIGITTVNAIDDGKTTFVATAPLTWIRFRRSSSSSATVISNITLREAVPYVGFDNGPDGTRDLWDASRIGIPISFDNQLVVVDRTLTATKGATEARAYLNLYCRPGATYRVSYTGPASCAARDQANGSGANIATPTLSNGYCAATFVATAGIMSLVWFGGASSFTVSNIRVEEVSVTAPIGAAPVELLGGAGKFTSGIAAPFQTLASAPNSVTASGGMVTIDHNGTGTTGIDVPIATVAGKTYRLWVKHAGGGVVLGIIVGSAVGGNTLLSQAPTASASFEFTATTSTTWLRFYRSGSGTVTFGDIEVHEVGHVQNGDFASDTVWIKHAGWSISGGQAVASGGTGFLHQASAAITTSKTYRVTYTVSSYSSGGVRAIIYGSGTNAAGAFRQAVGTYTEYLTPTIAGGSFSNTVAMQAFDNGTNTFTGTVDNIVIDEVTEQGQGSLVVEFMLPAINAMRDNYVAQFNDGTSGNTILLYVNSAGSLRVDCVVGGAGVANFSLGTYTVASRVRVALTWCYDAATGKRVLRASLNGAAVVTANPATLPQVHRLDLMNRPAADRGAIGLISRLRAYPIQLSDGQLQSLAV